MNIREIIGALEQFAPLSLQDEYDNAGLQIGLTEDAAVSGALLCLDVTEAVVDEAARLGCNLIVSHHPLLFRPLRRIAGEDYVQRTVAQAIRRGIAIYSAHTNLDNARGGVSWRMAEKLGLIDIQPLKPIGEGGAGAGVIGRMPIPVERNTFISLVKDTFRADSLRHNDWAGRAVSRVALCGGAGAFLIGDAVRQGADAFLTGEIGYHRFFGLEHDILLLEAGHYETEQYTIQLLHELLHRIAPTLPIHDTTVSTNPILYC